MPRDTVNFVEPMSAILKHELQERIDAGLPI